VRYALISAVSVPTFATSFHEYEFRAVELSDITLHGPFSISSPRAEDAPGPPKKDIRKVYKYFLAELTIHPDGKRCFIGVFSTFKKPENANHIV
jgi:hypothetical protein